MDRAHGSESPAALSTRFWRRNGTVALPLLAAGSTRESWPPVEQQRLQAREREKADARVVAQSLLLTLHEDGDGAVNPLDPQLPTPQEEVDSAQSRRALTSGLMLARHDWDPAQRHVAVAEVVQGHDVLKDMHDAAQRKRKSGSCSVRIVESGELLVPDEPEEPSEASSPLPLLPSLDGDANVERVVLPLGRPVASLHRHLQLTSSEPREVYHYQVATAGLPRGQKVLLGALSHDSGQPVLLLSYSSASAGFQEAHWALPVECGVEICSYQVRQQQPARLPDRALPAPPRDCPHGCGPCVPSLPRSSLIPSPPRLSACSASSSTAASTHRYCCRCGTSRCTRRPIASASWCTRNPSR